MTDLGIYDPAFVKNVFDRCSSKYIAFSYLCSMGFTERWRKQCVAALALDIQVNQKGYDLMAGTGEAWPHLLQQYPKIDTIVAIDISSGMHKRAIERLHKMRAHKIEFIEDDVLQSALKPDSADFIISTFGLKTFDKSQHQQLALAVAFPLSRHRILRAGGYVLYIFSI
jgi:ubiquinone/menaquinone biosynthesis C-methylase UbiE